MHRNVVLNFRARLWFPPSIRSPKTIGNRALSGFKLDAGYSYYKDKFGVAVLTPIISEMVEPARVKKRPGAHGGGPAESYEMCGDVEDMGGFFLP